MPRRVDRTTETGGRRALAHPRARLVAAPSEERSPLLENDHPSGERSPPLRNRHPCSIRNGPRSVVVVALLRNHHPCSTRDGPRSIVVVRLLRNHHPCSTRDGPRSIVVVRLDSRRATGAPTPWWPPNPGKMQNSSPSATFRSTFPPASGQNAERNALRAPSVLHFPRLPGKMWNSSPAAVFRSTFSPGGGNARAGGRLPRRHHPRSFRYGP